MEEKEIIHKLIVNLNEALNFDGDKLYEILSGKIGMTDNEIDRYSGNFDGESEEGF